LCLTIACGAVLIGTRRARREILMRIKAERHAREALIKDLVDLVHKRELLIDKRKTDDQPTEHNAERTERDEADRIRGKTLQESLRAMK